MCCRLVNKMWKVKSGIFPRRTEGPRVRALPGQPGLLASTVPIASGMIPCSFAKLESHKHLLVPVAALVSSGQEQEGRWYLAGWEEARVEAQG